jgi:hypothetical protein
MWPVAAALLAASRGGCSSLQCTADVGRQQAKRSCSVKVQVPAMCLQTFVFFNIHKYKERIFCIFVQRFKEL